MTSNWPVVIYRGLDSKSSTASPTGAFPTPPLSIGPGAAPPQMGAWPAKALVAYATAIDPNAKIEELTKIWLCWQGYGDPGIGEIPIGHDWGWGWDMPEITSNSTSQNGFGMCELPETSTTTTTTTLATSRPTTKTPTMTLTPILNRPDPMKNWIHYFNSGQKMSNIWLQNGHMSACNRIASLAGVLGRKCTDTELLGPFLVEGTLPFSRTRTESRVDMARIIV
ncbi:hypothetical protein VTH82DRAFT_6897 [Thermothelomyces myriococcoides]